MYDRRQQRFKERHLQTRISPNRCSKHYEIKFYVEKTRTENSAIVTDIDYDLVDKIEKAVALTRKSVVEILSKITKDKFVFFQANHEEFIRKSAKS